MRANLNSRDSNFELSRIVAMAMIIIWHFILHGLWGEYKFLDFNSFGPLHLDQYIQLGVSTLFIVGVNLFVLISGYYRIILKWRSIVNYYCLCLFYSAIILITSSAYSTITLVDVIKLFFISKIDNWFFKSYFILLFVSPILNCAINSLSISQYRFIVGLLLLITCVSGWIFKNGNETGYNAYQMFTMYLIGGYISKDGFFETINRESALLLYFVFSVLLFILELFFYYVLKTEVTSLLYYNNLLVILSSVSLFCFFKQLKIKSYTINLVASTVVAALFIQIAVSAPLYKAFQKEYAANGFSCRLFLVMAVSFFAIFLFAFVIEVIRKRAFERIISNASEKLNKICPLSFH